MIIPIDTAETFTLNLPADTKRTVTVRYLSARDTTRWEQILKDAEKAEWLTKERTDTYLEAIKFVCTRLEVDGLPQPLDEMDNVYSRVEIDELVGELYKAMMLGEVKKKALRRQSLSVSETPVSTEAAVAPPSAPTI